MKSVLIVAGLAIFLSITGCTNDAVLATAPVSGKILFDSQPVTGGELHFAPFSANAKTSPGRPAIGVIKPDGTFTMGTYTERDGVIIGKCRVSYMPPPPKEISAFVMNPDGSHVPAVTAPSPFDGLTVETPEVDIKPGNNVLEIKLVK